MKYNLIFSFLTFVLFTGCTVNTVNQGLNTKTEEIKKPIYEKKIEYKREPVTEELKLFIKNVMKKFCIQDIENINKNFINPNFGFYNLFKTNGNQIFTHQKQIFNFEEGDTEEVCHLISRVENGVKDFVIIDQDVKFDCSPEDDAYYGWSGDGLYLSDKTKTLLSDMMIETNKYEPEKYSTNEINKANFIEKMAHKVVLTPDIVFYVNKIDGKFYITLFDRITTDCSSPEEIENLDSNEEENTKEEKEDKSESTRVLE